VAPLQRARVLLLVWFGSAWTVLVGGCGARDSNVPGSSERQSDAEYDLAREYFFKGDPRRALDHCRKAIGLDGENAKALYFASTIHLYFCSGKLGLNDPDCRVADAEGYVRRALKVDENFREARNALGQVLILEQKYAEAIAVLEPLTKDPAFESSFLAWGNLGWAQVLSGRVNAGIESLRNSITEPRFCVGHYRLGVALERQGDLEGAEKSFTDALSVDAPDCKRLQEAWGHRGRVRLRIGKGGDARGDFIRCLDLSSDSPEGAACARELSRMP
jgi:Tfp pilus assembly protein PilF